MRTECNGEVERIIPLRLGLGGGCPGIFLAYEFGDCQRYLEATGNVKDILTIIPSLALVLSQVLGAASSTWEHAHQVVSIFLKEHVLDESPLPFAHETFERWLCLAFDFGFA